MTKHQTANRTSDTPANVAVSPVNGAVVPLGNHPKNTGGKPGRSGRPKAVSIAKRTKIRDRLSDVMEEQAIPVLVAILSAPRDTTMACEECGHEQTVRAPANESNQVRAAEVVGKFSVGPVKEISTEDVRDRLLQTMDVINEQLSPEDASRVVESLAKVWT